MADLYLNDVIEKKPAFVVYAEWYRVITRSTVEPLREFTGLYEYINANYEIYWQNKDFILLGRKDLGRRQDPWLRSQQK